MPTRTALIASLLTLVACAEPPVDEARAREQGSDTAPAAAGAQLPDRPDSARGTITIEGMPEEITLALFRAPDDFPLPFTAYVPRDFGMEATGGNGAGAAVRFVAEFGGVRNDRALVHLFVHPEGTDPQQALATVRAYEAGTGVPVSRGLEPLGAVDAERRMPWADHAYAFRYQSGGTWYLGTIGLGSRDGRMFHLVTHYPAEYGDGFAPRADMIFQTWRWAGGERLRSGSATSDIAIPSARPGGEQ